jgi:4-oxalocrotonate tautomerase
MDADAQVERLQAASGGIAVAEPLARRVQASRTFRNAPCFEAPRSVRQIITARLPGGRGSVCRAAEASLAPAGAIGYGKPAVRGGAGRWRRRMPEVYVYAVEGRTMEQKKALIKEITDSVVRHFKVDAEAVMVQIMESPKTHKAKGGVLFSERAPKP